MRITKPFYLGKYPVTQEQWEAVMDDNPSNSKGKTQPVERVNWEDCQSFLINSIRRVGRPVSFVCRARLNGNMPAVPEATQGFFSMFRLIIGILALASIGGNTDNPFRKSERSPVCRGSRWINRGSER